MTSRFIINADDFGMSKEVNDGIIYCFKEGIISSTTIIANGDAFEDAVEKAKGVKIQDRIGMHFNITEGKPLSNPIKDCARFCNDEGSFTYKKNSVIFLTKKEKEALKIEFDAQYRKIIKSGLSITHLDSHQHIHTDLPIFLPLVGLLKHYNIKYVRKPRFIRQNSLPIKIYKRIYQDIIKYLGFKSVDLFLSYKDALDYMNSNKIVEVMVHPKTEAGQIVDHTTKEVIRKYSPIDRMISYKDIK